MGNEVEYKDRTRRNHNIVNNNDVITYLQLERIMRTKISGIILTFLIALSQTASYSFDYSNCTFTY